MKKLDKMIIAIVLFISVLGIGTIGFSKLENTKGKIMIQVGGEVVKEIPLKAISESKTYEFNFQENIGYVEVKDGKVRMVEMNKKICPEGICSDTGWIDSQYQMIVCLPNQIIVTIEGAEGENIDV